VNRLLRENRTIEDLQPLLSLLVAPTSTLNAEALNKLLQVELPLFNRLIKTVDSLPDLYEMLQPYRKALEGCFIICCAALCLP
jgi:hypothetical protein